MDKTLENVIEAVRRLPEKRRAEITDILQAAIAAPEDLTPAQLQAVDEGIADAEAGRFASSEAVDELFRKYRPV